MGFTLTTKTKCRTTTTTTTTSNDGWGMGFLLVFLPEDLRSNTTTNNGSNNDIPVSSASSSPLLSSSAAPTRTIKPTNSNNLILTRAQSTISICALLVFISLLLFTLSTFEPTAGNSPISRKLWSRREFEHDDRRGPSPPTFALQRMGVLYRRGTKAMNDLVVAHVVENVFEDEFRLFLRLFHRSRLTANADLVFIFSSASKFAPLIEEENKSFFKLVDHSKGLNTTAGASPAKFNRRQLNKSGKSEILEPIWGRRTWSNSSNPDRGEPETELTQLTYGSVVGFEASELDPEDTLAGFLDHAPMSLRRWACYPLLLGRVKRKFKHVMLVDVKNMLVTGDPLGRVRNRSPHSVIVFKKLETVRNKHGKRNSGRTQQHSSVNAEIMMGGDRGIRSFSNAMLTQIVRAAMQHKKKNSVSETSLLSQLVGSESILGDNVKLILSTESIPDASSLTGSRSKSGSLSFSHYSVIQVGNSKHDLRSDIRKQICSFEVNSSVYRDC